MPTGSSPGGPWLVVGLGNPGPAYAGHRHNVGVMVVDLLAERVGGRFSVLRGRAEVCQTRLGADRVVLVKPRSYMNDSGGPVAAVRAYFQVELAQVVVVHDDLDLPFGALRLKRGGSDAGHNGLRSLTRSLGSGDYHRVRVGIGRPPGRRDPADFVLSAFSAAERAQLPLLLARAADAAAAVVGEGLAAAQNAFND